MGTGSVLFSWQVQFFSVVVYPVELVEEEQFVQFVAVLVELLAAGRMGFVVEVSDYSAFLVILAVTLMNGLVYLWQVISNCFLLEINKNFLSNSPLVTNLAFLKSNYRILSSKYFMSTAS